MWAFLEVFIRGKKSVFSTVTSHISPKLCVLNCALLCDSSLLTAQDKK